MSTLHPYVPGTAVALDHLPTAPYAGLRRSALDAAARGAQLHALFGMPTPEGLKLVLVCTDPDARGMLRVGIARIDGKFEALTPDWHQAHLFEREVAEQWGVQPVGHPWLKPVRFHARYAGTDAWGRADGAPIFPAVTDMYRVEGEEVHEVGVGPIHAGVIEPGHFRFQCHGETVYHLEIALGYQHRGIERALVGGPNPRTIALLETAAGDTTIGHAWAYALVHEGLSGVTAPARADAIRSIALELERLANHTGDLGALADDVAYLPTSSYCGRIRGEWLNLTGTLCGNRFGRSVVQPGGVRFDIEPARAQGMKPRIEAGARDLFNAVDLLFASSSAMARFEETGPVPIEAARALGLVGAAGRASGIDADARRDFATPGYARRPVPPAVETTGDVWARASVRRRECEASAAFLLGEIGALPEGPVRTPVGPPAPNALAVGIVEGWRGPVVHVGVTNDAGRFAHYKVVDPSFHNWSGLARALRNQQIFDFPLCNKSFNLSYCGHDL